VIRPDPNDPFAPTAVDTDGSAPPRSTPTMAKKAPPKTPRRVSHRDIAREANVSRVTVSLVLAGKDQTSEETRKRVMDVARRLKYRPNLLVQGMQTGRTGAVGVIMPTSMYFHGQIAAGIHDELVAADFVPIQLWVKAADDTADSEINQIHRLVDRRVDGVIIWPADVSVPDVHFNEIWQRNIPLVTVDRETTTHADHVGTDEDAGGKLAADHLLKLGHRRVAHVTFPSKPGSVLRRRESFVKAIQQRGGECTVVACESEQVTELVGQLLRRAPLPTAVFCATDPIAMKVYAAAASAGLSIPNQLSVVGYADFPFAKDLVPPLTTVRQDPYQMGRVAAQMLLDRVLERATSDTPKRTRIAPELIVRGSTAPSSKS
jgi:LacI family transcriptional regulator